MFKEAWAAGRRESHTAYKLDALVRLVTSGGGGGAADGGASKTQVVVRVDATRLAGGDGMCETATGPVPVDEAIGAILAGAFVKVVLRDGVDITKVSHLGSRHIPVELRTTVNERDGFMCVRPTCGATQNLELHHYRVDYAKGGPTAYWNLGTLCSHDHALVTTGGHELRGGPGAWEWVLPDQRPPPPP